MRTPTLGSTVRFLGDNCTVIGVGTVHRDHQPVPWIMLATPEPDTVKLTGDDIARYLG